MSTLTLIGRSSSHFTRLVRIFAHELEVPYAFEPLHDLAALDPAKYVGNPALKIPVLVDDEGSLFGSENICHALLRRTACLRSAFVMRQDLPHRMIANAEEIVVHAMNVEVALIVAKLIRQEPPPKSRASLERSLDYLNANLDSTLAHLPDARTLSFLRLRFFVW
jgi:glutathione S-transferase